VRDPGQGLPGRRVDAVEVAAPGHECAADEVAELRAAGTPVFIDMTADWCITCKVNEKAVFHTAAFRDLLKRTGTVYMVGDWTNQDVEISGYLPGESLLQLPAASLDVFGLVAIETG